MKVTEFKERVRLISEDDILFNNFVIHCVCNWKLGDYHSVDILLTLINKVSWQQQRELRKRGLSACWHCNRILTFEEFTFHHSGRHQGNPLTYCRECQSLMHKNRKKRERKKKTQNNNG